MTAPVRWPHVVADMILMPPGEFEFLVGEALDTIPQVLASRIDNCVIRVRAAPPPGQNLLGLYVGIPLTSRTHDYGGVTPDQIFIYRKPILSICHTRAEVVEQVRITVVHEIAHHFGISDERLHELGYG